MRKRTILWLALGIGGLFSACADELGDAAEKDAQSAPPQHDAEPAPVASDGGGTDGGTDRDPDAAIDPDADVDASVDGSVSPPEPDADDCSASAKKLDDFIAQHRSCSVDSDCVIVGDCSHADFPSVQRAHQDEAMRLSLATCGALDGPTYNAVCTAGQCDRVQSVAWCGGVPQTECPTGTTRRYPGCDDLPKLEPGCYADCAAVGNNAGCPAGYTCQQTSFDPCHGMSCDACGQHATLCLPAPACEVELSLGFDYGKTLVKLPRDKSTQLELWLINKTDRTLSLSFDIPCHGPVVSGLDGYDLWNECVAGVCAQETQRVELSLKPKEKLRWRTALVRPSPSTCNQEGLANGTYTPSFSLPISGAVTCGPAAAALIVSPP